MTSISSFAPPISIIRSQFERLTFRLSLAPHIPDTRLLKAGIDMYNVLKEHILILKLYECEANDNLQIVELFMENGNGNDSTHYGEFMVEKGILAWTD